MKLEQLHRTASGWNRVPTSNAAQLALVFGGGDQLSQERLDEVRRLFPRAHLLGCSTAGEIVGTRVHDNTLTVTGVEFARTRIELVHEDIATPDDSRRIGEALAKKLPAHELRHVFVLSDGLRVNGTELVEGLKSALPDGVQVTGGLSGDGARFQLTLVVADAPAQEGRIAALGFYGDALKVGCGSLGGWDPFGPDRLITRSLGNVLYELDGQSALSLYKKYLGEHATGLPSTGLLFPLALSTTANENAGLVRTILAVNEEEQSMTFAGDMPEGHYARLMKANFNRLVEGAAGAARTSALTGTEPELAILISCVGRKLVLKQRIEEEVEAVREVLGADTVLTGFYSYGEISPHAPTARCQLHNQTMTITTLSER